MRMDVDMQYYSRYLVSGSRTRRLDDGMDAGHGKDVPTRSWVELFGVMAVISAWKVVWSELVSWFAQGLSNNYFNVSIKLLDILATSPKRSLFECKQGRMIATA